MPIRLEMIDVVRAWNAVDDDEAARGPPFGDRLPVLDGSPSCNRRMDMRSSVMIRIRSRRKLRLFKIDKRIQTRRFRDLALQ